MKSKAILALLVTAILSVSVQADQGHHDHGHHGDGSQEGAGYHEVRGIFLGFDEDQGRITMAHEAVPGVMMAMRMYLHLPEGEALPDLAPGDKVAFQLFSRVEAGQRWYAKDLEPLPAGTELTLPDELREAIGH
ncbi:copper-binding protein [Halomonas sp. ANAO-440]|uniref:copper-binding protein n=1 Tax=Halomonas sp. ANAO-440 TaxID=2861360 RepID=UPI001CAA44B4|nr:copper-binding protein [Halomonas sp. ANAO-440]MBZ0330945.1 copper-binding protein [Halomonas sp. ANAO-440]